MAGPLRAQLHGIAHHDDRGERHGERGDERRHVTDRCNGDSNDIGEDGDGEVVSDECCRTPGDAECRGDRQARSLEDEICRGRPMSAALAGAVVEGPEQPEIFREGVDDKIGLVTE